MKYANQAIAAEPEDWQGYHARGKIHAAIKRHDDALKDLQHVKTLTSNVLPDPYLLAGEVYYAMSRFADGKQEYLKALDIHPANLEARLGVAQFSMLTENYIAALLEYDKINKEYPGTPPVLTATGRAYGQLKKYDKAMEQYLDAIDKWQQLGFTPPEEAYLEAAPMASQHLRKPELAILLFTQYLLH
jgi:tetratricopeptide (TPR) repeat protein